MIATPNQIEKISKAELRSITFQNTEDYFTDCEIRDRHRNLHLSILLANRREANVKIVFNTKDGYKELLAAIWGATDKLILLQGGCFIPVESVASVSLD